MTYPADRFKVYMKGHPSGEDVQPVFTDSVDRVGAIADHFPTNIYFDDRTHWAHPTEHVPLCIVVGTCAMRDGECRAVRSAEGVTCPECLDAMREMIVQP